MRRAVLIVVVVAVLLVALAWVLQRRLIYFPDSDVVPPAGTVVPGAQDVVLRTADGLELAAWWVPASEPDRGITVLVANGNAGNRAVRAPLARALSERGVSVLLFDYRGYGGNAGRPSEEGLALDVRAARSFLLDEVDVDPGRLIYFGESLGSAVATELAAEHPPAGLVLRSPFMSLVELGQVHYPLLPVGLLLRDRYPVVDHVGRVKAPVTVVLGTADSIVPPEQSRAVARAAGELAELVEVPGADHNDRELLDGRALVEAVMSLVDQVEG